MIKLYNKQRAVKIDRAQIVHDVTAILHRLEYDNFDIGLMLVNDATMRHYNRTYRGKDTPTDILSFPFHQNIAAGDRVVAHSLDDANLGDLVIDVPYVVRASAERSISFEEHLRTLLVHGIFHLLGYDHIADDDYAVMHAQEINMLAYLATLNESQ